MSSNTTHRGTTTGNPHNVTATQISDFDTEVSNNSDVTANTTARHTHSNKTELDLITDGDHDVRTHTLRAGLVAYVHIRCGISFLWVGDLGCAQPWNYILVFVVA